MQESMTRNLSGTIESDTKLKCFLEEHVWHKMMGWCKAAKSEVSGMGLCKIVKGSFVVYEVFFPLQYGSSGYTELDDRALAKLQIGLYNKKIPADHFRFWWHTHYNFNVFWSGTDDNNATTLARANGQWELSLVINQASEFRCRADFFKKVHPMVDEPVHVLVDNIEVFTCKNSRRQRRKPHYGADVKRWVKPMSELPEKQKPKFECTPMAPISSYGHWDHKTSQWIDDDDTIPVGSYNGEFGNWSDKWNERSDNIDDLCVYCTNRFCKDGSICKKNRRGSEDTKSKHYGELESGDEYGGYIWYEGFLLDPKVYKARMEALENEKKDNSLDDLRAKSREWAPKDETQETPEVEPCECGDKDCISFDKCIGCELCGGRCQVGTGYCKGCWDYYHDVERGAISEKSKSKAVN